ncbi:MAG: hypothetical protein JNK85_28460 [Verrucomicrobiales bacterium]|nr:hypothetical protein [Verrucomicrobiales bacterium]
MKLSTIATSVALLASLPAMAYTDLGNITINSWNPLNSAGAINVTATGAINATFNTFCLEGNESISLESTYNYDVSLTAWVGGNNTAGPAPDGDPLSIGAAYLFAKYAKLALSNAQEYDLQRAIWALEDEISTPVGNSYYNEAVTQYGANVESNYNNELFDGNRVVVLNLFRSQSQHRQDLLACVPVADGGATLLLLGAGLTAVGITRRRMA